MDPDHGRSRPRPPLVGRQDLLLVITDALDQIGVRGSSLLLSGEPGIGKSALLAAARDEASARGIQVVTASGTESELRLPFAALLGMVRPWQPLVKKLPRAQRDALLGAFGFEGDRAPSPFMVALGVLELMSEIAADGGLLILIDDAHVLDSASRDALAFLTRRVDEEPIVCLSARRDNRPGPWGLSGRELTVAPLTDAESARLVDDRWTGLTAAGRRQILALARGNPLALIELPASPAPESPRHGEGTYALTERLESAFADRYAGLPDRCRAAVLVGVANEGGTLHETLSAASMMTDGRVFAHDLQPAIDAGLVTVADVTMRFRHPLVRSAVWQAAPLAMARDVHSALAVVVSRDPDRQVWHRAMASLGRDDDVALDVAAAALRARRRGAPSAALALMELSAHLTADPGTRADRLISAVELAAEVGRVDHGSSLIEQLRDVELTEAHMARLTWIREVREDRIVLEPSIVRRLVDVACSCRDRGDHDMAWRVLRAAAHRCWWKPGDHALGREVAEVAASLPGDPDSPVMLFVRIAVQSGTEGDAVRSRLADTWDRADVPAATLHLQGLTAQFAGDPVLAGRIFDATEVLYRERGQLGLLAQTLVSHSVAAVLGGRFRDAKELTEEAVRLAQDVSSTRWQAAAQLSAAAASACLTPELPVAEPPTRMLDDLDNPAQWAQYAHVLGIVALAHDRHAEAFTQLWAMHTPGDKCYHETYRTWVLADLVEAGMHSGRHDEVAETVHRLGSTSCPSPLLRLALAFGRAMIAGPHTRDELFRTAVTDPLLPRFPFLQARTHLEYGAWLRRQRRRTDARAELRAARDVLDRIGAVTWANRARRELAACGEASPATAVRRSAILTAQELAIARLAALGLSNREIGAQLFLSHRTIGSHLYRIFPKLAVTSRVQLVEALRAKVLDDALSHLTEADHDRRS